MGKPRAKGAFDAAELRRLFGVNVRNARIKRNLSQKALAHLIGIDDARISDIERGQVDARLSTVGKIAQALGIRPSALLP